jgi:hypothetical protein
MATYRRRRRAVCLTRARSPMSRSKEGRRANERFQKDARVLRRAERVPDPRRPTPLFMHRTRRFGKPVVQQYRIRQRSHQKPPRNHFERGQCLHHLAMSLAPDDLVELVPWRANVGAKAKTLPFARCLRQSRCTNGGETTGGFHPSSTSCKTKAYDEVAHVPRPRRTRRPTWNSAHCNSPREAKCITGLICNGFYVMTVCNPTLWEYSGDSLGA